MARLDPLAPDPGLTRHRFGHAPALWLALPLLLGGAIDQAWTPAAGLMLLAGGGLVVFAWFAAEEERPSLAALALGGIALGAAWHQVTAPPQGPILLRRPFAELSVRVERANDRPDGEGWTGLGWVTDRDGGLFRRRLALSVRGAAPAAGAELKIAGHLANLPPDPRGYDAWVRSQGASLRLSGGRVLGELAPASPFRRWCQRAQFDLEAWLRTLPWDDPEGGALLAATMLGRTALLPADAKAAFGETGTLHLFAISGLHIAGMAAALLWAARRLRLPALPAGVGVLALLWLYVEITGASPSSVRAWIMTAFVWAGQAGERSTPALQSLALAAATTLLLDPEAVGDAGFQLSYAAVLAIVAAGAPAAELAGAPTLEQRLTAPSAAGLRRRGRWWLRRFLVMGFCVSCAATLAGAPLSLAHFGRASWGGVVVNIVLVPLSEIPLVLGLVSAAASPWPALLPIASWFNGIAALALDAMTWLATQAARMPWPEASPGPVAPWTGALGAGLLAACFLAQAEARSVRRLLGVPAALLALWWLLAAIIA
jgi:competence protein ComEC